LFLLSVILQQGPGLNTLHATFDALLGNACHYLLRQKSNQQGDLFLWQTASDGSPDSGISKLELV
jgi:hypothetical protein